MKPGTTPTQAMSEVDVILRDLKAQPGFSSYMIMNNDGIVIKYENIEYKRAVQIAHLVLDLASKAKRAARNLLESPENEVESIRLKSRDYELIVGQSGNFTLAVVQNQTHHFPQASINRSGHANGKKA
ncbi:Dynein light chain [Nannochloropsis gaditana]|uniref:Dynein light chain n=1 Tax=Nannochloropsis gaditana TaxID=72520 RepID=W7TDN2_9STRA|nr:Dynein light chain [Nannochloropsis gaditana]